MICANCGTKSSASAKFCRGCGKKAGDGPANAAASKATGDSGKGLKIFKNVVLVASKGDEDDDVVAAPSAGSGRQAESTGSEPSLKTLLYDFVKRECWDVQIKNNKAEELEVVQPKHPIGEGIVAELRIRVDLSGALIKVFLYPDIGLPKKGLADAAILANEISQCMPTGHIEIQESAPHIRFRHVIDVEKISSSDVLLMILNNAVAAAENAFSYPERLKAFAAIGRGEKINDIVNKFYNAPDSWPPLVYGGRIIY